MARKAFLMMGYLLWCINAFLLHYQLIPGDFISYSVSFFMGGVLFFLLFILLHIDRKKILTVKANGCGLEFACACRLQRWFIFTGITKLHKKNPCREEPQQGFQIESGHKS